MSVRDAYGEEVHLFLHVHLRGYDREGKGKHMDSSYYDKYGRCPPLQTYPQKPALELDRMDSLAKKVAVRRNVFSEQAFLGTSR